MNDERFEVQQETSDYREIVCPFCSKLLNSDQLDTIDFIDEETRNFKCAHCGKDFHIRIDRPIEITVFKGQDG